MAVDRRGRRVGLGRHRAACLGGDGNNSGGFVDAQDFVGVQNNFGSTGPAGIAGDADCSRGFVDAQDFVNAQNNFSNVC